MSMNEQELIDRKEKAQYEAARASLQERQVKALERIAASLEMLAASITERDGEIGINIFDAYTVLKVAK